MKKLLKKNQLMITALAIMLAIAGYLQFAETGHLEENLQTNGSHLVNEVEGTITEIFTVEDELFGGVSDIESLDTDLDELAANYLDSGMTDLISSEEVVLTEVQPKEGQVPGEAVFTSAAGAAILSDAKITKEQVRSKNKETLLEIINSSTVGDEQKTEAITTMVKMTRIAEQEAAAELLLQAKGFSDVVVSINGNAVDVVVNALTLTDVQRAQIEDIIKRKTEIGAENIIISTVVQ